MSGAALKAADNDLTTAIALRSDFHCDAILMMEQYGLKVKKELELARKAVKSDRAGTHGRGCASEVVGMSRTYIAGVLECDPRKGVRGSGGSPGEERVRELLNHAHPRNAAVKYGIGTVFTHRINGYRRVVYGWDSVYRAPQRGVWDEAVSVVSLRYQAKRALRRGIESSRLTFLSTSCPPRPSLSAQDPSPSGGRKQPHYYAYAEDGCAKYVAQANVEIARIPAGSTTEQAAALLRQYVPLFNLRNVAETFRTIQVAEWEAEAEAGPSSGGGGKKEEGEGGERSGQIRMVMTPWMRSVWPFG